MKIAVDKAQQKGKHTAKHQQLAEMGHELIEIPSPVGDYFEITPDIAEVIHRRGDKLKKMDLIGLIDVSIDTKRNCEELYSCLIQGHKRFSDSCFLAMNNNIRLVILIENEHGFRKASDLKAWKNPRYLQYWKAKRKTAKAHRPPASNIQLIKIMHTMNKEYGVEFQFCAPEETGKRIVEILRENRQQ